MAGHVDLCTSVMDRPIQIARGCSPVSKMLFRNERSSLPVSRVHSFLFFWLMPRGTKISAKQRANF